jgi:hypothetical protein
MLKIKLFHTFAPERENLLIIYSGFEGVEFLPRLIDNNVTM